MALHSFVELVETLAYWQLLLMSQEVEDLPLAWYLTKHDSENGSLLTPEQVQRGAGTFIAKLGIPASLPRPAGKGRGRKKGYRPAIESGMKWFARVSIAQKALLHPLNPLWNPQISLFGCVWVKTPGFVYLLNN